MLHKPPMLLVDRVVEEEEKQAKTSFTVGKNCIFLDENGVLARSALIEIAAQSFAAADIFQKTTRGRKLSKGFLVSVRGFQFDGDAQAGDEIICSIRETNEIAQLHVIEAELHIKGRRIAVGELRIFEISD
jgi:predicted hotdog family 3-hydroxylacyl-ACP dehydratase